MDTLHWEVRLPETSSMLEQGEEWVLLMKGDCCEKIRIHEYSKFYRIPGLYEEVVCKRLKCDSPEVVVCMVKNEMEKSNADQTGIRALDFGAGNGIVGEWLRQEMDCGAVVGIDIIPEAIAAARRDRPGVYDEYYTMNLLALDEAKTRELRSWNFNLLVTVGALGFNDIPTRAFLNAFDLIEDDGWVAFNIKDEFLSPKDPTGYHEMLDSLMQRRLEVCGTKTYCHRLSVSGKRLHYRAVVGRKRSHGNPANTHGCRPFP